VLGKGEKEKKILLLEFISFASSKAPRLVLSSISHAKPTQRRPRSSFSDSLPTIPRAPPPASPPSAPEPAPAPATRGF